MNQRLAAPLLAIALLTACEHTERAAPVALEGHRAAVAAAHPLATQAGVEILAAGGNAVDAAVATALALGVVEPHASGLGGGGFMVVRLADGTAEVIDYREMAPAATDLALYRGEDGEIERSRALRGPLAVGVPGQARGLALALERHGTISWAEALAPAIRHAEAGFPLTDKVATIYFDRLDTIFNDPGLSGLLAPEGLPLEAGNTLRQPALAATLRALAANGPDWFYTGPVAEEMVRVLQGLGGVMTAEDLAAYEPRVRRPLRIDYQGHELVTIGPPSVGAVVMGRALTTLIPVPLASRVPDAPASLDAIGAALSESAAAVRPLIGDPLTMPWGVDVAALISGGSLELSQPLAEIESSMSTTHLSVIDAQGNAVALTQTINYWLGSGIMLPEAGVMLNNEMADFTFPGSDVWIEDGGNHPLPGARPATNMTPTIVVDADGEAVAAVGTPGGTRIPSAMVRIMTNLIDHGMSAEAAILAPRVHPPEPGGRELDVEGGFAADVPEALADLGWEVDVRGAHDAHFGGAQALVRDPATGRITGAADPRRDGTVGGL